MKPAACAGVKFLIVSRWGELLDIACAIKQSGALVKYYIEDKPSRGIGHGFVPITRDWRKHLDWADLIIFDYTGYGAVCEALRAEGRHVIGGTRYTDRLELDRQFGQNELRKHGVRVLNSHEFNSFADAIRHVTENPHAYVIKPCDEIQELKQLLFVGQDEAGADVIRVMKAYERTWGNEFGRFQLQRKVTGVEVSVSGFFNGSDFARPLNITFEHKKLFPGELGVATGEMGTSMLWVDDSPLFDATLGLFTETLRAQRFIGSIDINCIVNHHGIYPLEFTARFGFPQIFIQRAGLREPIGDVLMRLARGELQRFRVRKGYQVGAYMAVPPFPFTDRKSFELFSKDSVVIFKKPMAEGIHPMHLKKINNEWLVTGDTGLALLVSGTGLTMAEAQKQMRNRISQVILNNAYYRTDIGDRWVEDSDRLRAWGLL